MVGVGASAGGIEPLKGFFRGLSVTPGFAVVVVTHLLPDRHSDLTVIVSRLTGMPVRIAEDLLAVDINCVYVVPTNSSIEIEAGHLRIKPLAAIDHRRNPIDCFFASLAVHQQDHAAGVILSGTGTDGSFGIKCIKEAGGMTCAQADDVDGLGFRGMPRSAIATGFVDFIAPATQIGVRLTSIAKHRFATHAPSIPQTDATCGAMAMDSPTASLKPGVASVESIAAGERELQETRDRLSAVKEQFQTLIEELKTSNEELLAANEEFESSKEELQALNEQLNSTNTDLQRKVNELDRANGDLQALFESTDVATIFLDKHRLIRSFTPIVSEIFNILPIDRGRPLTDLSSRLSLPGFADDIALVYATSTVIERRVEHDVDTAHFLMRIAPYRSANQVMDGVVINFTRVSTLTVNETRQHVIVAELQHRTRNLLTVVQSIAMQTLSDNAQREAYLERLAALGRVQSLISHELDDRIGIAEILQFELNAHGAEDSERVTVRGPRVTLHRGCVQTLALAIHELITNAVKYGALKHPTGKLCISWEITGSGRDGQVVALKWHESGVVMTGREYRQGYGHNLLQHVLPYNLSAKTVLDIRADGIICQIEIPLMSVVLNQIRDVDS